MRYELKQTPLKNGKFHYQVIDENGTIISDRKSNREYVACTINGSFYFGRLDLIGKGDYKRLLNWSIETMNMTEEQYLASLKRQLPKEDFDKRIQGNYIDDYKDFVRDGKETYERLTKIAYRKG